MRDRALRVVAAAALGSDRHPQLRTLGDHLVLLLELRTVLDLHLGSQLLARPLRLAGQFDQAVLGARAVLLVRCLQRQRPAIVVCDRERRLVRDDRQLLRWLQQRARVCRDRLAFIRVAFARASTATSAPAAVASARSVAATTTAATAT